MRDWRRSQRWLGQRQRLGIRADSGSCRRCGHPAHAFDELDERYAYLYRIRHGPKVYEYPRYNFTNRSNDIRRIFCDTCDLLGIEWRVMNAWNLSVARRASVAQLDEFIGPKT